MMKYKVLLKLVCRDVIENNLELFSCSEYYPALQRRAESLGKSDDLFWDLDECLSLLYPLDSAIL